MDNYFAHKTSIVESIKIGKNTKIWQFAVILENSKIGNNCNICAHTFLENDVIVGDNVTVKCGVYIWDGVRIEDNVFLGPNVTFTNDIRPRSKQYIKPIQTLIKKNATIGANSTILAGITIGKFSMAGIGSIITKDIPDYALVYGNPATVKGWIDKNGKKLEQIGENRYKSEDGALFTFDGQNLKEIILNEQ